MTMKDLAKLAGVSVATVSKAFRGGEDISQQTRERIFKIAREYGCYGKFHKGKYHKKVIVVICPEMASSYYTRFVEVLRGLIEQAQYIPVISADGFNEEKQRELIEYYASYMGVDGIIVFGLKSELKKGYDTPIVSLFHSDDSSVDFVGVNFRQAMMDALKVLVDYGHEHIGFVGEPLASVKANCFKSALQKLGKDSSHVVVSQKRFEKAGEDGVKQLFTEDQQITALVCAYDYIAFGAIKQLKRQGLRVPEDVSVIGMDNISISQYTETTLSSIGGSPEEVCCIAWDLLQKKLKNPYYTSKQNIVLRENLILRESVARNKKNPRTEQTEENSGEIYNMQR